MNNPVQSFYDEQALTEWERFIRHRTEFAMTKRALAEYLPPPPARILDCGGGPGRYAIHLAQLGYQVTLLDLSANNLALAHEKAQDAGVHLAEYVHGNALDLSRFAGGTFDAVLLLGPLYHLTNEEDRRQAVHEARRVLKPGGPLFAAFITLYAPLRDAIAKGYMKQVKDKPETLSFLMGTHTTSKAHSPNEGFTEAWFTPPAEVRPFMESCGLRTLRVMGVEGLAAGHEKHLNAADDETFAFWTDLIYPLAEDPHVLGASDHLLYVGE